MFQVYFPRAPLCSLICCGTFGIAINLVEHRDDESKTYKNCLALRSTELRETIIENILILNKEQCLTLRSKDVNNVCKFSQID